MSFFSNEDQHTFLLEETINKTQRNFDYTKQNIISPTFFNNNNHSIAELDEDKFLFLCKFNSKANHCCFGFSLEIGIRIISIFYLLLSLSVLFTIEKSFLSFLYNLICSVLLFCGGTLLLYTTFFENYTYAKYSLILLYLHFIIKFIEICLICVYISINFGSTYLFYYLIIIILLMIGNLYMIWIVYSYTYHLKRFNMHIIRGDTFHLQNELTKIEFA